ncbi:MAG: pentapeptide repeat-containing protein [Proteobacteria bacterium]|nr:pentapeptide repeat-containing protein [Pseudomonadota bacterium]
MANEKKEPLTSADELLARCANGERDFEETELTHADLRNADLYNINLRKSVLQKADLEKAFLSGSILTEVNLVGANIANANLSGADLRRADLRESRLGGADFEGADLSGADLRYTNPDSVSFMGADLRGAKLDNQDLILVDLRFADLSGAILDAANLTTVAFDQSSDLMSAKWQTLIFAGKTYHREAVERGDEILPIGMGPRLAVLIETARLKGAKTEVASTVVDYLASAGIQAEVANTGGAGSTIKLSVRSKDDAEILLQAGDGVCRLLGLGSGVENLLPAKSSLGDQVAETIAPLLDERFDLARRQAHLETDEIISALESIGRDDLRSVKLSGFTDAQMEALKNLAEFGSEYLEVRVDADNKEAQMTPGQKVARDVYESKVAKPLRTVIGAVFQSLSEGPEDA